MESGPGIREALRDLRFNVSNITATLTAAVFTLTGSMILFATVAADANLSMQQTSSWMMNGFGWGAISSIFLSLYYKQPIFIAPSLSALLVMGPMFKVYSAPEMVAGYLLAGVIIFLLGISGIVALIGKYLPIPIIMGMIAGVFMSYGLKIVHAVESEPLVAGVTILAFLLTPRITKKIPPQATALIVGVIMTSLFLPIEFNAEMMGRILPPLFILPQFNPTVFFSVSIPVVLLCLADTLKGYGVLSANGYDTPLNTLTSIAGLVSIVSAFGLSHGIGIAGPITAIIGSEGAGPKQYRYAAGLLNGITILTLGILSSILLPYLVALPTVISDVIAGLAMLGLFTNSLEMAFGSKKFKVGAFTAFIVGMSNVVIWGIGAPVWSVLFGVIVSFFIERDDFKLRTDLQKSC